MQTTLTVADTTIRLETLLPTATTQAPAIILLHGSGGNVDWWFSRIGPLVTGAGIALFAPHYFDRTGTLRADYATITDGHHVPLWIDTLSSTLAHVAAHPAIDPTRIAVVGVSLGAYLALGHAAQLSASTNPADHSRIRCLVDLSGGLVEPYYSAATSHFPPTLIVHGEADTVVPATQARTLAARLTELHVPHETLILPSEDHWFSNAAQPTLLLHLANFLSSHLKP